MLRVDCFLPYALCPLTLLYSFQRRREKHSRLAIGLFFTRWRLIARFYPALRGSTCRLRRPTHSQRGLILGDREVAPALYIVHSPEINVRPGKICGIRLRTAFRG